LNRLNLRDRLTRSLLINVKRLGLLNTALIIGRLDVGMSVLMSLGVVIRLSINQFSVNLLVRNHLVHEGLTRLVLRRRLVRLV
jgi:hypothetical protein